jgi:stage V sporulation protein R
MKTVVEIVRQTSIYFQPQIRTKILNEGWASYWHEALFLGDDRIRGCEVSYACVNAKVTSLPRVGINPYALGMRMLSHLEENAERGRLSYDYQKLNGIQARSDYDRKTGDGRRFLFELRRNCNDFLFINTFVDQDFVDRHKLFVAGKRMNSQKGVWEFYVQSRKAEDYRNMLLASLYHPPHVTVVESETSDGQLSLHHAFEGKPLVPEYIPNTMIGIEYLWGAPVKLETTELVPEAELEASSGDEGSAGADRRFRRVTYTMEKRQLSKVVM